MTFKNIYLVAVLVLAFLGVERLHTRLDQLDIARLQAKKHVQKRQEKLAYTRLGALVQIRSRRM